MASKEHSTVREGSIKRTVDWKAFSGRVRDLIYKEEEFNESHEENYPFEHHVGVVCESFVAKKGQKLEPDKTKKDSSKTPQQTTDKDKS